MNLYKYNHDDILSFVDFTNDLHNYQKEKIDYYHQWVNNNIKVRALALNEFLFKNNMIELNSDKISEIELFLEKNLTFEEKPIEQIEEEKKNIPLIFKDVVSINKYVMTNDTKMLCFDVGVLVGEFLIKYDSKLQWKYENSYQFSNYANLILCKKGFKAGWSPVIIVRDFILQMISGEYKKGKLENAVKLLIRSYEISINL